MLRLAYGKRLHVTAVRLGREAFALEPKRAADVMRGHRYDAACSAALAGCGQGTDRPAPDESARAALREQALEWLQADLAAWSKLAAAGPPASRASARRHLRHWKVDRDLAGVRDRAALIRLPEAEQIRWHAFWIAVDELLAKVEDGPTHPPPAVPGRESPTRLADRRCLVVPP